ncbi:MAG: ATP-grasp domain-containing protein [Candidatus Bathyarchaeia archaeon]
MTLRVGLTYNLRRQPNPDEGLPEDFYVEFDSEETVDAIAEALRKGGCKVTKIEADERAYVNLSELKPDIVFNIAEGLRGESRESHIPALLEMMGIPYTGSGPLTLAVALNKALTHQVLEVNGVPSPDFQVFTRPDEKINRRLRYPLVVKPLSEGSSKGIRNNSLVGDEVSLRRQVSWVVKTYNQPAIVEEFLPGREFTVGLIGNGEPTVLPIVEISLDELPSGASPIYSYEAKWIWDLPEKPLNIFHCPAEIPPELKRKIERTAIKAFKVLNCRDLCRIDMRLDVKGNPHVLEVNPLPGLIPDPDAHSCLPEAARVAGFTYDQLVCTIFWQALKRYNMQHLFEDKSLIKIP